MSQLDRVRQELLATARSELRYVTFGKVRGRCMLREPFGQQLHMSGRGFSRKTCSVRDFCACRVQCSIMNTAVRRTGAGHLAAQPYQAMMGVQ